MASVYPLDMTNSEVSFEQLNTILSQPEADRGLEWENRFLSAFYKAKIEIVDESVQTGPDSWPYLFVKSSPQAGEPVEKVCQWLSGKGVGLALNTHKMLPDYVFTYGMVWDAVQRGGFDQRQPAEDKPAKDMTLSNGQELFVGVPSDTYLPNGPRKILREFFQHQGVKEPKVLLVSRDQENYDLCFSAESLGLTNEKETEGVLEAISWFLPNSYQLAMVSEKMIPHPFQSL